CEPPTGRRKYRRVLYQSPTRGVREQKIRRSPPDPVAQGSGKRGAQFSFLSSSLSGNAISRVCFLDVPEGKLVFFSYDFRHCTFAVFAPFTAPASDPFFRVSFAGRPPGYPARRPGRAAAPIP